MPPCTDYLARRRRAPPSTSLNQPILLTLPLGTLRKWRGELPRGSVLARFCRFDLESTNVDPKLLGDGRSGSSSRTFARAGSSQSRTQRRNMDFVGGLEHRDSCGIGGHRGNLRAYKETALLVGEFAFWGCRLRFSRARRDRKVGAIDSERFAS